MTKDTADDESQPEAHPTDEECLRPGPVREAHIANHPFTKNKQLLQTAGTNEMYREVLKYVRQRDRGIALYCPSRGGKTRAIKVMIAMFRRAHPHIAVLTTQAIKHEKPSERALWLDILTSQQAAVGHSAALMRIELIKLLTAIASVNCGDVIILFVDEAQEWPPEHWRFMKGLVNTLEDTHDIWVLVIPVGQTALTRVREDIKELEEQGEDLMSRFMNDLHPLRSLRSKEELVAVLRQFDDAEFTAYPVGSGCCYSRFYLPQAYSHGWRLEQEAGHIWNALNGMKRNKRGPSMRYLMELLREFLLNAKDAPNFHGSRDAWTEALKATSYATKA